jgi:hypothetical protein
MDRPISRRLQCADLPQNRANAGRIRQPSRRWLRSAAGGHEEWTRQLPKTREAMPRALRHFERPSRNVTARAPDCARSMPQERQQVIYSPFIYSGSYINRAWSEGQCKHEI